MPVKATALDSCGVQASQEREAADIPHGCLSIQSLLSLHRKSSTKSCRESLLNDSTAYGHGILTEQIYGFAEFLGPVLPSYQPLSLVVDGLENISSPTPYRNPSAESECSPRLGRYSNERLGGSHARVEQVPPSSLRRPLPTTAAQPSVELSHTL